jgi:hypothetical protein
MLAASALPIQGPGWCTPRVLQGTLLAEALRAAIERKRRQPATAKYGPTALANALGMTQPSASELIKTGRLAKSKIWTLVEEFADVVGPDHWGLPMTSREMQFLNLLRQVPESAQDQLLERLQAAAEKSKALTEALIGDLNQTATTTGAAAATRRKPPLTALPPSEPSVAPAKKTGEPDRSPTK